MSFKEDVVNKANTIINSLDYKVASNYNLLLEMFDLSNNKNIDARKFDGLFKNSEEGIYKYKDQLEVLGSIFKSLGKDANGFIVAALDKDKALKETLDNQNHFNFIDLKTLIVLSLQNPQISGVSSIESLSLLKDIYAPDTIKGQINKITSGMDATPIINAINEINPKDINQEEIKKIKDVFEIIKETSEKNQGNDEKLNEIKNMILKIEKEYLESVDKKEKEVELEEVQGLHSNF